MKFLHKICFLLIVGLVSCSESPNPSDAAKAERAYTAGLTKVRVVPYFSNGTSVGVRISNLKDKFLLDRGLVNGDVIFSIAGAAVRDASDLKPLWNEKAVSIRGQRNEKMLDIILPQINYVSEKYESKNEPQRIAKETLKSLSNLDQISSSTKAVPYYKNGEAIGVRLFAMQDQSPLKVIGLQSGDIVIAIGDSHVVDPESYFQKLLQALHQSHPTELQLERDRERLTIILE